MLWEVSSGAEEKTEETSWNFGKEVKTSSSLHYLCENLRILLGCGFMMHAIYQIEVSEDSQFPIPVRLIFGN